METKERRQMSDKRYPDELELASIRQITEGGYAVFDAAYFAKQSE